MSVQSAQPPPRSLSAARRRYRGSVAEDLAVRLKELEAGNWIVTFGASVLLTVLPLIILLGALANERIDDDLSRHLGVNRHGANIVAALFRHRPTGSAVPIALGLLIGSLGTLAMAGSLQVVYERVFRQHPRGRDIPRYVAWTATLLAALISEAAFDGPLRAAAGAIARDVVTLIATVTFSAWTMHFLVAGRVPWRRVLPPALATALMWLGLALFSSLYFSSAVVSEDRLYGPIGVIFVLLSWFIAIGAVLIAGAASGALWQERSERPRRGAPARDV